MQYFKDLCRLCGSNGINEIDIFSKDAEDCSIADDLKRFCSLNMENKTELPSKICENCKFSMKNLKEFVNNCIKTQEKFSEQLLNQKRDSNECQKIINTDIKLEHYTFESLFENNESSNSNNNFSHDKEFLSNACSEETLFDNNQVDEITQDSAEEIDMLDCKDIIDNQMDVKKSENNIDTKRRKKRRGKVLFESPCNKCDKICSNPAGLTVHMRLKHSILKRTHVCKVCGKRFERLSQLEHHQNVHLPLEMRPQLSCPHCEKIFNSESGRWTHIHTVHDKRKEVICEECGKQFPTKHHLVRHKISHTEEKNIQCPICPAKFKRKVGLRAHMEIHGESFPCSICGIFLNTKKTLKKHMIVHSDARNYKCNFCNKDFKREIELNYHLITHIGIKPYECRICCQKFTHDMTYRRHLKSRHPIELAEMVAKGERISSRNFPPPKQLKAINEAAKGAQE